MLKILQQPYPYSDSDRRKIFLSLGAGFFVSIFLIYFEPFGINDLRISNKVLILTGYGIITSATMLFLYFVVPKVFPNYFKEENWTVGREIFFFMTNFVSIAFLNVLYALIVFSLNINSYNIFSMVGYTFILGLFPTIGIVFSNYIYHLKQYSTPPQPTHTNTQTQKSELVLVAENERDSLKLFAENLLYIETSDNYSTVVFLKDEQVFKELIRSSLTRLEGHLQVESIVRCHRSFIVNLNKVVKVSGNAQGFKLHLKETDFIVPVARKYSDIVHQFR
jgi:hypothetical protein